MCNPPTRGGLYEVEEMRRAQRTVAIILLALAVIVFVLGAARIGFVIARATVGLYEAIIIAVLGLVLFLTSRRGA